MPTNVESSARRALHALKSAPLPQPPDPGDLIPSVPRRPGELHDPLVLRDQAATELDRQARRTGVHRDVLASVTLEFALVVEDLGGIRTVSLQPPAGRVDARPLSAGEADYLRSLTITRRPRSNKPAANAMTVAVPVRLIGRLGTNHLETCCTSSSVDTALAWETAAMIEGRTLSECLLLQAASQQL